MDILVLAFKRSTTKTMFTQRKVITNVEIFLIPTPPPSIATPQNPGKSYEFKRKEILGVHIDTNGVICDYNRIGSISSSTHDTLCIPLTNSEKGRLVDFIHRIQQCTYNTWGAMLSQAAPILPSFLTTDDAETCNFTNYCPIKKLHPGQFVTLVIQICIDDIKIKSKMWGYKSHITTPDEIYQQLRGSCMVINPDVLWSGHIQAWGVGLSPTGPNRC
jgi:hypothetical protein